MTEVMTRGSIPSQAVNRQPLPERYFITLCELVTWRATGKARSAETLQRFMRRHQGQRRLTELRRVIENEAANLILLLRSRKIKAFGHVDHRGRGVIPAKYLMKEVFAEPQSDTIAPDYMARFDLDDVPIYRSVCFLRTDAQRTFGIAGNRTAADDTKARDDQLRQVADTLAGIAETVGPPALGQTQGQPRDNERGQSVGTATTDQPPSRREQRKAKTKAKYERWYQTALKIKSERKDDEPLRPIELAKLVAKKEKAATKPETIKRRLNEDHEGWAD